MRYERWFNENLKHKYHHENYFEAQYARDPEGTEQRMLDPMFREYYERQKLKPLEDDLQFTAEDCYAFRNACLHSGMSKDKKRKFALIPPPPSGGIIHKLSRNGTLQLQIDILCLDICEAVDNWSGKVSDNTVIQ